ncbi:SIMPL domain-containing protein [Brevundimonas goettingensis]|uniref:SIMPL domain-containing protein n=1 Tax=Brevundimonas goettingensis TaxID=2774190 RepID=A0A975C110_9CAUL|nr:SIMPL domain-containing protein [Brevundimonas goettingensis]QTC91816.1 SIMPL domain-containing protein [Brevundimonas goettingensis]
MTLKFRTLAVGGALMVATALTAPAAFAQSVGNAPVSSTIQMVQTQPSLNLSATGEVKVAPDMATITFGVVTEAQTAQEAMAQNATQMTRVAAALRRAGIAERDIQTSGLNLQAQYDYVQNEPPKLRGYQATNRVTVNINDLTRVGTTADAVVAAGVNQIDGISFGLKDPKTAEDQARRLAVQALQAKARLYAEALGVQLGGIRSLNEGGGYTPQPPMPVFAMARMQSAGADSTPVSAGELSVKIDITGVYDIR